jgi:hypothetical protein
MFVDQTATGEPLGNDNGGRKTRNMTSHVLISSARNRPEPTTNIFCVIVSELRELFLVSVSEAAHGGAIRGYSISDTLLLFN